MLRALRPSVPSFVHRFRPVQYRPHLRVMSENASAQGPGGTQTRMQKTNAKEFYCLTEKDVSCFHASFDNVATDLEAF